MSPAASTRWCPTPEQLMILEEMYRGGIRTPNASQIQQITTHLSFYGKIEGKNVFYWFQNHKARDRQKLRRKLCKQQQQQQQLQLLQQNHHHLLHHFDSSGSAALQHLSSYNPPCFLPQGSGLEVDQSTQAVNYSSWNVDISGSNDTDQYKSMMTMMYGRNWLMKMDHVGNSSTATAFCCNNNNNKPLKTLELFPISTTGLKDECTTSHHFSTSSSNLSI